MPIVTITMKRGRSPKLKKAILDAVHAALALSGASPDDRFQRVIELSGDDFVYHPTFPDLKSPRTDDFLLIEVLLGVGRSVKVKRAVLADMIARLAACGIEPDNVMVVFQDIAWENFSPAGGRIPHG